MASTVHLHSLSLWVDCEKDPNTDRELKISVDETTGMIIEVNNKDVLDLEGWDETIPIDACLKIRDFLNYCFPPNAKDQQRKNASRIALLGAKEIK